jgi:hypothetical protein
LINEPAKAVPPAFAAYSRANRARQLAQHLAALIRPL